MGNRNMFIGILFGMSIAVFCIARRDSSSQLDQTQLNQAYLNPAQVNFPKASIVETVSAKGRVEVVSAAPKSPPKPIARRTIETLSAFPPELRVDDSLSLKELLRRSIEPATVRLPTRNQLVRFERLIAQSLRLDPITDKNIIDQRLLAGWAADGWSVHLCGTDNDVMVMTEMPDHRSGRGIYAIRLGAQSNVFVQAPHRFYDSGSGLIARKLFQEQPVRAVAWNSVHRRQVDLSHTQDHFINAFTRAIVTVDRTSEVIQIHGFGRDHQHLIPGDVSAIISNGTKFPGRYVIAATTELKQSLGAETVRLFPAEVERLGGTKNQQGSTMRDLGSPGFLHIELDSNYRDQLRKDASKRDDFFRSLTKHCKLPT